jgi:hypothetical protein
MPQIDNYYNTVATYQKPIFGFVPSYELVFRAQRHKDIKMAILPKGSVG